MRAIGCGVLSSRLRRNRIRSVASQSSKGALMDPERFDTLAKRFVTPTTRRATLGGLAAGGLLSAFGLGRAIPETQAAQPQTCTLAFVATVRLGPSAQEALTTSGTEPG